MANNSGLAKNLSGIVLVVIGIGLVYWGYQMSGSVGSQISQAVTGADTDKVLAFYIGGGICFLVGLFRLIK